MAYCFFQKSDPLYQRSFCVSNYYPFLPTAIYINLYLLSCSTSFFFPKMGHSKKIVLFLKPDPFLQKIFRMQPTTWYNWFFNPKTVLFLQNLIHWLTSIDQILTTQSYNSLPSLLLCLANVRFIKTGTKSSSLLLLCFVPVFLKQTLELHN